MQTSLPDLPFTNYGDAELRPNAPHSIDKTTPRNYPMTDLETLMHWASFPDDINQVIQSAIDHANLPLTPFILNIPTTTTFVENEQRLHAHAIYSLHGGVERVLQMFGVNGWFAMPGGGNAAIIGDPDFSWVMDGPPGQAAHLHPKLVVEYKTWWSVDLVIENLLGAFDGTRHDTLSTGSLHALEQTYGYMTFNNNKFGILTNWKRALFLRRAETQDRKTLEYYLVELGGPLSMLKAWVGMVLLARDNWFYASATPSRAPSGPHFRVTKAAREERDNAAGYHMQPVDGEYQCLPIDFRLCHFDISSARRGSGACILRAQLSIGGNMTQVVCKIVDITRYSEVANSLEDEACAYAALEYLQGDVIPIVRGFYEVWGMLRFLALEPVGDAIPEDEPIDHTLRMKMRTALQRIHDAGFIHGDIARRNFCRTENNKVFLVDLEGSQLSVNPADLINEMNQVDEL
ncbi:hypothetical protein F5887DRAFT_601096 [Amanita rubescens]|nr:hypothetical protein F5887DRAFT_601096 [Amanita rubescens]